MDKNELGIKVKSDIHLIVQCFLLFGKHKKLTMNVKEKNELVAIKGIRFLIDDCAYTQVQILEMFKVLEIPSNKSSLSNLYSGSRAVKSRAMNNLAKGIKIILEREQCHFLDETSKTIIPIPACQIRPITKKTNDIIIDTEKVPKGYTIHEGRIDVPKKVLFYEQATYEVIELGLRLRRFTDYFQSKRDDAFLDPIRTQLANGVNFKCYVLNPTGNFARRYYDDRAKVLPKEQAAYESSPKIIAELKQLCLRLNREGYTGKISLFQYDHFPYFHASVIDAETENGVIYMSPYLFGVRRANTPVIEVHQKMQKKIFKRYWSSVKAIINSPTITQLA